ncbi:MAG: PEP-CTERM sorting domain-containing protein [Opitutales bacterium]
MSFLVAALFLTGKLSADIALSGSSQDWFALPGNYDSLDDQRTGQGADDIQGEADNPGFFTGFLPDATNGATDGNLAFRVRFAEVGQAARKNKPAAFKGQLFVGIDANFDGAVDLYLGASDKNNKGITIRAPGTGRNISPNTTMIGDSVFSAAYNASNFNYRPVDIATDGGTTNDIGGEGLVDYYLSFAVPFLKITNFLETSGIVGTTTGTSLRYVLGTATQSHSLNQDIGGIDGNDATVDLDTSWEELGAITVESTTSGGPVPEPSAVLFVVTAAGVALLRRPKRRI